VRNRAHDAIQAVFNYIRLKPKSILDAGIEKCFDNIAREPLLDKLNAISQQDNWGDD
jgi:RNA-directed DNA polymerase